MRKILRKCGCCDKSDVRKSIDLETDKYLIYKKKYYHYNCYIEMLVTKKRGSLQIEEAQKQADQYYYETMELEKVSIEKEKLINWIYDSFNISYLSKRFYIKLEEINNGSYKGLKTGISNSEILEIFKKMENKIHSTIGEMVRKGNSFTPEGKVNYALAIVLGNYDSYINWKNRQKKNQLESNQLIENIKEKNEMNINEVLSRNNNARNDTKDENEINISELIDELF